MMISLEMVGYFSDEKASQNYPVPGMGFVYPSRGNFIAVVGRPQERKWIKRIARAVKRSIPTETLSAGPSVTGTPSGAAPA